jgi:hypothetical protein
MTVSSFDSLSLIFILGERFVFSNLEFGLMTGDLKRPLFIGEYEIFATL